MKKIILFLILVLAGLVAAVCAYLANWFPAWMATVRMWFLCAIAGGFGGTVYCLRGVYLNACVRKRWDPDWQPWYFIRPFVSVVCGAVSYLFLSAGLLILESAQKQGASELGFFAFAFIAGLNVDKFISKIEDVAQAAWGIEKSRASGQQKDQSDSN